MNQNMWKMLCSVLRPAAKNRTARIEKAAPKGAQSFAIRQNRGWLKQYRDEIYHSSDAQQPAGKKIEHAQPCFAFIEFVCSKNAQKQAQSQRYPVISSLCRHIYVDVAVCVLICIVDDDIRLAALDYLLHLSAAQGADDSICRDFSAATFAELLHHLPGRRFLCNFLFYLLSK